MPPINSPEHQVNTRLPNRARWRRQWRRQAAAPVFNGIPKEKDSSTFSLFCQSDLLNVKGKIFCSVLAQRFSIFHWCMTLPMPLVQSLTKSCEWYANSTDLVKSYFWDLQLWTSKYLSGVHIYSDGPWPGWSIQVPHGEAGHVPHWLLGPCGDRSHSSSTSKSEVAQTLGIITTSIFRNLNFCLEIFALLACWRSI